MTLWLELLFCLSVIACAGYFPSRYDDIIADKSGISDEARVAWHQLAQQYRVEDARLDSLVTMSFDANYIEFTLRYVVDCRVRRSTKSLLFSHILEDFQATGGKVQIGSTTIELTDARTPPQTPGGLE